MLLVAACASPSERIAAPALPEGLLLEGDVEPVRGFLEQLATLEGTPAARFASQGLAALADCETAFSVALPDIAGLTDHEPRCEGMPGPLRPVLGPTPLSVAVPLNDDARLIGSAHFSDGGLQASGWLELRGEPGAIAIALPDGDPGAPWLAGETSLIHARGRSQRLPDPGALAGSDAADVLQLRGGLLADALLDRRWEIAIYPPDAPGGSPAPVVAVGHRSSTAATSALRGLVTGLQQRWALPIEPIAIGDAAGWCLGELHLLPELLPCGVVTDEALVGGWHRAALLVALSGTPPAGQPSTWVVAHLDRIEAADRLIAPASEPTRWPWATASLEAVDRNGTTHLTVALTPPEATP